MNQHIAVQKMMVNIKIISEIPEDCYSELRDYLKQMYVVGYDEARKELCAHNKKRIGQFNKQGHLLNDFASLREAAKKTGFKEPGLYSAVLRGNVTRQGHLWKYLPILIN
jgi:hypothetical protein